MKQFALIQDLSYEDWLRLRKKGIGGSDVGAIVGASKYRSEMDVWREKTSDEVTDFDNFQMKVGRVLEPVVAKLWEEETGKKVKIADFMYQHDDYPFMLANIDRWVHGENAGLEIKTASSYAQKGWDDGKMPEVYYLQCLHYMAVTGADRWYLTCLIGNSHLEQRTIERNEKEIEQLIQVESDFWQLVETKTMPAPDGSKASTDTIKEMYPAAEKDKEITLDDMAERLQRYDEVQEMIDRLTVEQEQIKQEIQAKMGDAERAYIGDRSVTWKEQKGRTTFDTKAFKAENEEVYNKFLKTGKPFRVFKIK